MSFKVNFNVVRFSHFNTNHLVEIPYSYLSASTGFLVAAFQLCQLTVNNAITNASNPAKANIHQLSVVL